MIIVVLIASVMLSNMWIGKAEAAILRVEEIRCYKTDDADDQIDEIYLYNEDDGYIWPGNNGTYSIGNGDTVSPNLIKEFDNTYTFRLYDYDTFSSDELIGTDIDVYESESGRTVPLNSGFAVYDLTYSVISQDNAMVINDRKPMNHKEKNEKINVTVNVRINGEMSGTSRIKNNEEEGSDKYKITQEYDNDAK